MKTINSILELENELSNDEYVSQLAFYLKNKLVKVKKLQKDFELSSLNNLKLETDRIICFVENPAKTSRHKLTLDLKRA